MISERTIQEVFDTARIEDVVGDFLNLKRKGSNMVGLCPFHDEKTPSFMVSPTKNIFKCFGCGRGGGSVQFVMEHERYTFPEAIRYLAGKYRIEVEETVRTDEEKEHQQELESLHLINAFAARFFKEQLFETDQGKSVGLTYFKERGYREGVIKGYDLGYSPSTGDAFKRAALSEGFQEERLQKLGLITQNGRDFYRGRVIFPIHNLSGKVIGFGGRTLRTGKREPKYVNSPESPVYSKSKSLYGLFQAKNDIRKLDKCFLVEGYTDVLSLHQAGIQNVVSSSGTALTTEQIKALKRFTRNVTVLYDADEAGIKAAMRGLDLMLEQDIFVRLVLLPENQDPDSFVRTSGRQEFKTFVEENEKDFILFKAGFLSEESAHDPIRRSIVVRDIVQSLALVPDPIRRAMYIQECSRVLEIDESLLVQETNTAIRSNLKQKSLRRRPSEITTDFRDTPVATTRPDQATVRPHRDEYQEHDIVRILILYGDRMYDDDNDITVTQYVLDNIRDVIETFENPVYKKIVNTFEEALQEGVLLSHEALVNHADQDIARVAVEIVAPPFEYSENWTRMKDLPLVSQKPPEHNYRLDAYESILRFKQKKIHHQISANQNMILAFDKAGNDEKRRLHLKMHGELLRMKSAIEDELNTVGIRL